MSNKPMILNLEPDGYSQIARQRLESVATLRDLADKDELEATLAGADVIITRLARYLDAPFLALAPRLKAIATATTGLNHIDMNAVNTRGIDVLCLRGETEFLSRITATAELHWGLLLAAARHLRPAMQSVLTGEWDRDKFQGVQLSGKTIGLVGYGRLGRIVARYAKAFGMQVLAFDRNAIEEEEGVEEVELDVLLARSHVLSIHLSLNEESANLLDAKRLARLRPGAIVVNTARGEVVDETVLAALVESGQVAAVSTDVLCGESIWDGSFPSNNPLWQMARKTDRVVITPHVGGACPDAMRATEEFIAEKIVNFIEELRT